MEADGKVRALPNVNKVVRSLKLYNRVWRLMVLGGGGELLYVTNGRSHRPSDERSKWPVTYTSRYFNVAQNILYTL